MGDLIEASVDSERKAKEKEAPIESEEVMNQEEFSRAGMESDHSVLTNPYHNRIIMGILFITPRLLSAIPHVNTLILGLRGGVLPMFLKKNLPPTLKIVVVESDRVVLDIARDFFGLKEDANLEVQVSDGIEIVKDMASTEQVGKLRFKPDFLIVDVDSTDISSGLCRPGEGYVARSFLLNAKKLLSDDGMFIMNLVSRCSSLKEQVYSQLKQVFCCIFHVEIEQDVSEVIFALKTEVSLEGLIQNSEAHIQYAASLGFGDRFIDFTKSVKKL